MSSKRLICPVDPLAEAVRRDPYPVYTQLRKDFPVCWSERGFWLVYRHADVRALLSDPRCDHWDIGAPHTLPPQARVMADCLRWLSLRPPAQLRNATLKVLSSQSLVSLQERLACMAQDLLAGLASRARGFDVVADFADPFTFAATCEVVGIPAHELAAWRDGVHALDGELLGMLPVAPAMQAQDSSFSSAFSRVVHRVLAHRREHRGNDLVSAMWEAVELGDDISPDGLANLLVFLFYAGHKNIMSFIGNAMNALLAHDEQAGLLRASPALADSAFSELLRFDGPVHYIRLVAREPLDLAGQAIAPGDTLFACVASSNRDPQAFADPDRLDLTRAPSTHLGFGRGPLQCIGAALARMEGSVAIRALMTRFPRLRSRNPQPPWALAQPFVLRGLSALPVEYHAPAH